MGVVRLPQQSLRTYGPKTIVTQLPNLFIESPLKPVKLSQSRTVTINDSPRAGQSWSIQSAYFEFPKALKSGIFFGGKNNEAELELRIELLIGGITVAKQIFLTIAPLPVEPGEKWPIVGNLEAFITNTVYPGQGITIFYELTFPSEAKAFGEGETDVGRMILTYTQTSR